MAIKFIFNVVLKQVWDIEFSNLNAGAKKEKKINRRAI